MQKERTYNNTWAYIWNKIFVTKWMGLYWGGGGGGGALTWDFTVSEI